MQAEDRRSMTLLLAAVGATVAALFELTVTTYLRVGGVQPHLVLVLAIIITIAVGLDAGLVWAFVGGLALDVLAQRPLGSTAFALLLCVGGASVFGRLFSRVRPLAPIIATFFLSIVYSMVLFGLFSALRAPLPVADPLSLVVPPAAYDAVLAALLGPLAVSIHDHRVQVERVDW
jgi:rod shape-determining protein MreD